MLCLSSKGRLAHTSLDSKPKRNQQMWYLDFRLCNVVLLMYVCVSAPVFATFSSVSVGPLRNTPSPELIHGFRIIPELMHSLPLRGLWHCCVKSARGRAKRGKWESFSKYRQSGVKDSQPPRAVTVYKHYCIYSPCSYSHIHSYTLPNILTLKDTHPYKRCL